MQDKLPRAPLSFSSIRELLERNASKYPNKEAVIAYDVDKDEVQTITYGQLLTFVQQTCSYLLSLGIKKDDTYSILMQNTPEVLLFELAGAVIGATTVPLDYKRDLLERKIYKLKETKSKALLIKVDKVEEVEEGEIKKQMPDIKIVKWWSFGEFVKLISSPRNHLRGGRRTPRMVKELAGLDSTYIILYTSGTTAHPKGAVLSQRACLLNAAGIADWQKFTNKERFNIVMPLHHINSTIFCLSILLSGGTIVLNSRYSASRFWKICARFGVTNTSVVPTILHDQLGRFGEFGKIRDKLKLKRICIGSAPVLPAETVKFYKIYKIRVIQGYGQTETALRVAGVPVNLSEEKYIEAVKANTIGRELANNHLAIMKKNDSKTGEPAFAEASAGEEGEICIRGPILAQGYLNDPEVTQKTFKDGWFHSGDLGKYKVINGEKYFYIMGRIKEIIIKGGVNISPSAIEDVLLKNFPEIEEVAVVGIPDERMGEEIAAVIVLKQRVQLSGSSVQLRIEEDIKNKKIEGLAEYEMPRKVFFMDNLPKTSTGKIQRVVVKKMVNEMINSTSSSEIFFGDYTAGPRLPCLRQAGGQAAARVSHESVQNQPVANGAPGFKASEPPHGSPSLASPAVSVESLQKTHASRVDCIVRQIKPTDKEILEKAAEIESQRFGMIATYEQFRQRAKNGVVLGAFERDKLVGTISCLRLDMEEVERLRTWEEATRGGSLANNNPDGDTLLCVAISVREKSAGLPQPANDVRPPFGEKHSKFPASLYERRHSNLTFNSNLLSKSTFKSFAGGQIPPPDSFDDMQNAYPSPLIYSNAKKYINDYISKDIDHVLNFHKKAKGGLGGAKVWKILENGRPEDSEAMGYNVLMMYPKISQKHKIVISSSTSPSVMLIENALYYAYKEGIKYVVAFSRPAGFSRYLETKRSLEI